MTNTFLKPQYLINLFKVLTIIVLVASIFSCSTDKKIDDKNAVAVFVDSDLIKQDPALKNLIITIPQAIINRSWFGNNSDNNQIIENFSLSGDFTKKNISYKSVNISYSFIRNNQMIFAPAIVEDKIYILDDNGHLYAKNLSNYQTIWKTKLANGWLQKNFTNGKISYFDGKIFATDGYNVILCFDAKNGKILWQKTLSSILISAPISDGDQVFLVTDNNKTYSLLVADGTINWIHSGISKSTTILGSANPVPYKNYIISSYSSGEIYALNKKDGESVWVRDLNLNKITSSDFVLNDIDATPLVKDDIIYTIGNGGFMMAIKIADGNILWQKELASITDFWIADNFIYLINNNNQLICLYKKTGDIIWFNQLKEYLNNKKPTSHIIYNGIIMADNNLIMTNSNNELLIISPFDGKILKTKKLSGKIFHNPIIANDKLYLYIMNKFSTSLYVAN